MWLQPPAYHVQDTSLPPPGCSALLSASPAHLTTLSASLDSDWYPDPPLPLPNSFPCRQNEMTNDPDTHHIGQSGAGGAWRNEALSRDGEVLAGTGKAVARSGHWDRQLVWWPGGQWKSRPVTVRVVDGTPKLLE